MEQKTAVNLESVQKTLLLPLWGRAVETKKEKPLLFDYAAVNIINKIGYDFTLISQKVEEITQLAWIGRSLIIDKIVKKFLEKNPSGTVVNIGCGLDTTFERIDNGSVKWYDLDLPDVIELRRCFIDETDRCTFLSCSCFDDAWFDHIKEQKNVLFIAGGVFYYFEEKEVKSLFIKLADRFPGSELLFDVASPVGIKLANQRVLSDTGMSINAVLKWGLVNIKDIPSWDARIKFLNKYSFYRELKGLSFRTRLRAIISDAMKIMFMLHFKLEG